MSDRGLGPSAPPCGHQPRVRHAWRNGIRRVNGAPAVLLGAWLVTMLAGLPLTLLMRGLLLEHLGSSDIAIVRMRRKLLNALREFKDGAEPPPALNGDMYKVRAIAVSLEEGVPFDEGAKDYLYVRDQQCPK